MNDMNEGKIEFFFTKKISVHIECHNGRYYNGMINEINSDEKLMILFDRKLGEIPIMIAEIKTIEPFKIKNGKN